MSISRLRRGIKRPVRAVANASHRCSAVTSMGRPEIRFLMLKRRLSPSFMGLSSYCFCSGLGRLQAGSRHVGGHGLTHPAA